MLDTMAVIDLEVLRASEAVTGVTGPQAMVFVPRDLSSRVRQIRPPSTSNGREGSILKRVAQSVSNLSASCSGKENEQSQEAVKRAVMLLCSTVKPSLR